MSVAHWLSQAFSTYVVHVQHGNGYQFWSGVGSDAGEAVLIGAVYQMYRRHNCHVYRCPRVAWHPHPGHGHPVCKHHHPHATAEKLKPENQ